MSKYNDAEYRSLIEMIFHDSYYADVYFDTKIEKIRQYTEIIIRRLLRYDPDKLLTLGHENTIRQLDNKGFTEPFFRNSLDKINSYGSDRTHTQVRVLSDQRLSGAAPYLEGCENRDKGKTHRGCAGWYFAGSLHAHGGFFDSRIRCFPVGYR